MSLKIIFTTAIALGIANSAGATTCSGKWGNSAATTVEFKSGNKVKYCYEAQCWTSAIYKSGNDYMFRVGKSSASVELKASGKGYKANWRAGNDSSNANLTCK